MDLRTTLYIPCRKVNKMINNIDRIYLKTSACILSFSFENGKHINCRGWRDFFPNFPFILQHSAIWVLSWEIFGHKSSYAKEMMVRKFTSSNFFPSWDKSFFVFLLRQGGKMLLLCLLPCSVHWSIHFPSLSWRNIRVIWYNTSSNLHFHPTISFLYFPFYDLQFCCL